jgi:hypothetical protein
LFQIKPLAAEVVSPGATLVPLQASLA